MEKDILQKYKAYFSDAADKHLSYEAISMYIMDAAQMSQQEQNFFQEAINNNADNLSRFEDIFDETLEFDLHENMQLTGKRINANTISFSHESWDLSLASSEKGLHLTFARVPAYLTHQLLKVELQPSQEVIRILDLSTDNQIPIEIAADLDQIQTLKLIFLQTEAIQAVGQVKNIRRRIPPAYWLTAAAVALLLGIIFFSRNNQTEGEGSMDQLTEEQSSPTPIPVPEDSLPKQISPVEESPQDIPIKPSPKPKTPSSSPTVKPPDDQLATQQFQENPILERFIERRVRNKQAFRLVQPGIGTEVSMPISLEWENTGSSNLQLILVNRNNQTLWEGETSESSFQLDIPLSPGLYYLKFIEDNNMLGMGKFLIR